MPKGEVVIDERMCKGCGLCIEFCSRGVIAESKDKLTVLGMPVAEVMHPEKCNACGVCAWMCPDFAIDVYKYVEEAAPSA